MARMIKTEEPRVAEAKETVTVGVSEKVSGVGGCSRSYKHACYHVP